MNWLAELNSFERLVENGNYLASSAQLLWYKLMWLNNRCGWQEWFAVDNLRLMSLTQTNHVNTLTNNRNKLIGLELIEFKKGKKACPNKYKMIPLNSAIIAPQIELQSEPQIELQSEPQTAHITKRKPKLKPKPKPETAGTKFCGVVKNNSAGTNNELSSSSLPPEMRDPRYGNAINAYIKALGRYPSGYDQEYIKSWIDEMGEGVVPYAIELGAKSQTKGISWGYIEGILKRWKNNGLLTLENIQMGEKARVQSNQSHLAGEDAVDKLARLFVLEEG